MGQAESLSADIPLGSNVYKDQIKLFDALGTPKSTLGQDVPNTPQNTYIRIAVADKSTAKITKPLKGAASECRTVKEEYLASCLAGAFRAAAKAVKSSQPDYRDARKILTDAAKKLEGLQKANADKSVPKKRSKNGTYRAVKKEAVTGVKKSALKIVQEAETMLIRSSGSGKRQLHYQRISQAVGSPKVLLRS